MSQYAPSQSAPYAASYAHSQGQGQGQTSPPSAYHPGPVPGPASMAGSQALSLSASAWGNPNDLPRARYDGSEYYPFLPFARGSRCKIRNVGQIG